MAVSNFASAAGASVSGTAPVGMGALAGGFSSTGKYSIPGGLKAGSYYLVSYKSNTTALKLVCGDGTTVTSIVPSSLGSTNATELATQTSAAVWAPWKNSYYGGAVIYNLRNAIDGYVHGSYGQNSYLSTDGVSWSQGPFTPYNPNGSYIPIEFAYGNGYYVFPTYRTDNGYAVVHRGTTLGYYQLTAVNYPGYYNLNKIAFGAGVFIIGYNSNGYFRTTDGSTLTQGSFSTIPGNSGWDTALLHNGLAAGSGSLFFAAGSTIGYANPVSDGRYNYSTDGITWNTGYIGGSSYVYSAAYGNGKWVVMMQNGFIYYSTDGINWTYSTNISSAGWITFTNGKFAFINSQYVLQMSPDAITWTTYGPVGVSTQILVSSPTTLVTQSGGQNFYTASSSDGSPGSTCTFSLFTDAYNILN